LPGKPSGILNSGSILADAEAHYTFAAGIDARGTGGDITNSGLIEAYARSMISGSYGLKIDGSDADVLNTGDILAFAESDESTSAWGINAYDVDGSILNSGSVTATTFSAGFARSFALYATETGAISNEGSLTASATGTGTDSGADAFGIEADFTYGDIDTSGTISVTSTATGTGYADSEGIDADDTYGTVSNSGDITAFAEAESGVAEATGIDTDESEGIANSGSISATAYSASSNAKAWGIDAAETSGSITNTGSISSIAEAGETIHLRADAYGIYAYDTTGDTRNDGDITALTSGYYGLSFGIMVWNTNGGVANSGTIVATGTGVEDGQAFGIVATGPDGNILNTGDIFASASGANEAYAEGMDVAGIGGSIINEGTITAVGYTTDPDSYADVYGIDVSVIDGTLRNSGTISAMAESADANAYAIYLYGVETALENTGTLSAAAIGDEANAYGAWLHGNGDFRNSGAISVSGLAGAAIYVNSGPWDLYNPGGIFTSGGTRTLIVRGSGVANLEGPFSVSFYGDPESPGYVEPLRCFLGGTLNLNDATLLAQAGNDIVWNTPYPVIENDASTVSGDFAGLASANPNIAVSWEDAGSTGEDSAVVFRYDPQASVSAQALRLANFGAMQGSNLIQQRTFSELLARHVRKQEILLADSGQTASDSGFLVARAGGEAGSAVFIRPYLKTLNRPSDGELGYDGSLMGIIAGYEWLRGPELTLGLHAGLGLGSVDFKGDGYDGNDENQYIYSLGIHGAYNPGAWHFDGSATLYAARHEYDGLTGGGLTIEEEDDYTSYGAEVEAVGGHVFTSGDWAFMPYAGLGYSWINAPSHTTDAEDSSWDTHYGSVDEHVLRSILGAQVSGNWAIGETRIVPTVGLRWEYALTDNEISISQSLPGVGTVDVTADVSRSSVIGDASLTFVKGAASMELGAMSQYNSDYESYGGWLTLKWHF
jgi:hypothetical protein